MRLARAGNINARVEAMTAYRVHIARLASGREVNESPEAAAGAVLEAESQQAVYGLHEMYKQVHTSSG